ncbi:MAG: hypothetical protein ACE5HS_14670 [bacterium]
MSNADKDKIAEERKKMRRLRVIVDLTAAVLYQGNLTTAEATELVEATRKSVLRLFPDKAETFDLIYKPRFERIIQETRQAKNGN